MLANLNMSNAEAVELPSAPGDVDTFELSMEDNFTIARIKSEIDSATSIEELKKGATLLLNLAVTRQAVIRSLIRRIGQLEFPGMKP